MSQGYSGYRKEAGFGFANLSNKSLVGLFVILVVGIAVMTKVPLAGVAVFVLGIPVALLLLVPLGATGRTAAGHLAWKLNIFTGARSNRDALVAGALANDQPVTEIDRIENLPGVLAPLKLLDVDDGRGGRQVLVWNRATGVLSAILRVAPTGITLADPADATTWVTAYGAMLADLGYKKQIESVTFNIESAPGGGTNQRQYVLDRLDPGAPGLSLKVAGEILDAEPSSAADVSATVTFNFNLKNVHPVPETLLDGAAEVVRLLPSLEQSLAASGATVTGRASTQWLIRRVRAAFDPAIRMSLTEGDGPGDELLEWIDAGPIRTESTPDVYAHDSGLSVTWAMTHAPRGTVRQHSLVPLLAPGPFYKRLCYVYRPYSAAEAAQKVEDEITGGTLRAMMRRWTKKDTSQREYDDQVKARRAAQEESLGAGYGRFTMYVTTTARTAEALAQACANVEDRMGQTKIRFRRCRGAQAAAFATSLGLGIDPTSGLSKLASNRWLK